jgi:hypothetical protein
LLVAGPVGPAVGLRFARSPGETHRNLNPTTVSLLPAYETLIEQRIREARERGEFDNLPGAGQALPLDDDLLVPEEVRVAHRILKNAGYVPPEAQQISEINQLIAQVGRSELMPERDGTDRRLRALLIQLELAGRPAAASKAWHDYQEALLRRGAMNGPEGAP